MIETRHIHRLPWWKRNAKVILQVRDDRRDDWRDATAQDLDNLDYQKDRELRRQRDCQGYFFPVGVRVTVNDRSGFHIGAHGTVMFQEPSSGRIWVERDGGADPCYFMADELDYELGVFTAPQKRTLFFYFMETMERVPNWWIALGPDKMNRGEAIRWCRENGAREPFYRSHGEALSLLGWQDHADAMLFYMAHL